MSNSSFEGRRSDARLRFDTTLVYAASDAFRWSCTIVGLGLAGLGLWAADKVFHLDPERVQNMVGAALIAITSFWLGGMALQGSVRRLLLEPDGIVIPIDPRNSLRWPYADVARYSLAPARINLGLRGRFKGQSLTIESRRAGVPPIVVFVFDSYPIRPAVLRRLDEVVQTNQRTRDD